MGESPRGLIAKFSVNSLGFPSGAALADCVLRQGDSGTLFGWVGTCKAVSKVTP